jgi:hypothetical protein
MALIRKLFFLALFLASTFGFVVLFDHGTTNYVQNCQLEFEKLKGIVTNKVERKKDQSDKIGQ